MFAARVAVSHGATIAPTEAAEAIKTDEPSSVATPSKIRKPTSGIVTLSLFEKARYHTRLTLATRWFQLLILFCIFTTSILAGIETYGAKDGLILALDVVVLAIFAIEVALRILVEFPTPWQFFIGQHWISNWFDFIVVVLGVFAADSENAASSFSLLPLLRLLRLSKLVSKVPAMKQILSGLAGGIKSAVYIIALIVLVLYIYAIVAIHVFKENNPFHYHSLPISLLSLFRAATLVDWTKIAYIDILGCDSDDFVYKSKEVEGLEKFWYCLSPESSYFLAPLFWSSFIVISSLVMLSLFVGSITIAMSESMERLKHEEVEHNRHHRLTEQLYSRLVETSGIERLSSVDISSSRRRSSASTRISMFLGLELSNLEKSRAKKRLCRLLKSAWGAGDPPPDDDLHEEFASTKQDPGTIRGAYLHLSKVCHQITASLRFNQFSIAMIVLAGLLVGVQTNEDFTAKFDKPLFLADTLVLVAFTVEIVLKVIAEGLYPFRFFVKFTRASPKLWNVFDFVIVAGNYALLANESNGEQKLLSMLRLVRLLRVLRVVRSFPELQVIVEALITGLKSIGYIGGLLLIVIYMFGILGTTLFGQNDPFHFGSLHMAILTLFRISTMEGWSDIMYINMYGCDLFGYESMAEECTNPKASGFVSAAFFVFFVIISSLGLLTLFVSVVTTSMDEAKQNQTRAKNCEERIQRMEIGPGALKNYKAAFSILDLDNSGSIDEEELIVGLQSVGLDPTPEQVRGMLFQADVDRSGQIDLAEFIVVMTNEQKKQKESRLFC